MSAVHDGVPLNVRVSCFYSRGFQLTCISTLIAQMTASNCCKWCGRKDKPIQGGTCSACRQRDSLWSFACNDCSPGKHVFVGRSTVMGRGLYAAKDFKKDEEICKYGGVEEQGLPTTSHEWLHKLSKTQNLYLDGNPGTLKKLLVQQHAGLHLGNAQFANYSSAPNCRLTVHGRVIRLRAKRAIAAGDELYTAYGRGNTARKPAKVPKKDHKSKDERVARTRPGSERAAKRTRL